MAGTVVANLTEINNCDATTGWSGTPSLDSDYNLEGTGCLTSSVEASTYTSVYDLGSGQDWSSTLVLIWMLVTTSAFLDTKANGGMRIRVEDTSLNFAEWYVGGNDTYNGGWFRAVAHTTTPADNQSATAPNMAAIQYVGVTFDVTASFSGPSQDNCFWDILHQGQGLIIHSGTSLAPGTFQDFLDAESTNYYGIVKEEGGALVLSGNLTFGDSSGINSTYFKDTSKIITFDDRPVPSDFYKIQIVGNTTGTTSVYFGSKSGTAGISGCVWNTESDNYTFTATDTNITDLGIYGCTFLNTGSISLPAYATTKEVLNSNFEACAEVLVDTCILQNCNFINADDNGIEISSTSHNVTDSNFISCPDGVEITTAGTYTFDNLQFTGNTYDIENSGSSATVIVNAINGANPSTHQETGVPAGTTTIVSSVSVDVHAEDNAGTDIQYAQVFIRKSGSYYGYTSHNTNNTAGLGTFEVNETVDTDLPQTGWLHVWDSSSNTKQNYRYASWTGLVFTLKTEVTGSCTSTGSSTQLLDTGADFGGTTDLEEGDTIRNTTDTGAWAIVDEIVSSTELLTTPLQGGTTNVWTNVDGWSIHKLAVAYVNTDLVDIPLFNGQTDVSGDISTTFGGTTPVSITVRIRSNEAATKYIPYKTSGTITSSGYALTAVLAEDTVAT